MKKASCLWTGRKGKQGPKAERMLSMLDTESIKRALEQNGKSSEK